MGDGRTITVLTLEGQALAATEGLKDVRGLLRFAIRHAADILRRHGRRLVAWDEVLDPAPSEGGSPPLQPDTCIQAWRGVSAAVRAAAAGHTTIASPTEHCYFDYDVAITDLRTAHSFCPFPSPSQQTNAPDFFGGGVVGGEFNLWTEYLETPTAVDFAAWPRGLATAEVLWAGGAGVQQQMATVAAECRWESFTLFYERVKCQYSLFGGLGIRPGPAFPPGWSEAGDPPEPSTILAAVPGSSVVSTMPTLLSHYPEFACDGNRETYFQSSRSVRAGDFVELCFVQQPLEGCVAVRARTGRFERNSLLQGVLQLYLAAMPGSLNVDHSLNKGVHHWDQQVGLKDGEAVIQVPAGRAVTSVRLLATADQDQTLVLQELVAETIMWPPSLWQGKVPFYSVQRLDTGFQHQVASVDVSTAKTLDASIAPNCSSGDLLVKVWTSFPTVDWHGLSQVLSGECGTSFCWSRRCIFSGDSITLSIQEPLVCLKRIIVVTGEKVVEHEHEDDGFTGREAVDYLESGCIEVTKDAIGLGDGNDCYGLSASWQEICTFKSGIADGMIEQALQVQAIRIRAKANQKSWLKMNDLMLDVLVERHASKQVEAWKQAQNTLLCTYL